jgi:hypothetical protein
MSYRCIKRKKKETLGDEANWSCQLRNIVVVESGEWAAREEIDPVVLSPGNIGP